MNSQKTDDSVLKNDTNLDMSALAAKIPTLQKMASYQIAIEVWYNYLKRGTKKSTTELHYVQNSNSNDELNECSKLIQSLGIPRFLENELKKCLTRVRQETIDCQENFEQTSPSTHRLINRRSSHPREMSPTWNIAQFYKLSHVDLNCFVWYPNGRIDYKSTAIKLTSLRTMTEAQRFVIMSNHCLENEIKRIHLYQLAKENFIERLSFYNAPVQFYWFCYLNNDIRHNIPLLDFNSADEVMARRYYDEKLWEGFQYFWDRMGPEEQVSFISERLCPFDTRKSSLQPRLFFKMSHHQLTSLSFLQPVDTIKTFLVSLNLPRHAIWAWMLTKDKISEEKFFTMVNDLLLQGQIHYDEKRMSVFLEIWNTGTDHHREFAAQDPMFTYYVVKQTFNNPRKVAPSAIKFLVKFLTLKDDNFRRDVILENTFQFALVYDLDVVGEVVDLCLPKPEDKMEFWDKNDPYISPYFCEILYSEDDFNELNIKLLFCIDNLNLSSNFVKAFIESRIMANKFASADILYSSHCKTYWKRLRYFIEEIFQENTDASSVAEMKKSYICSFAASSDRYERYSSFNELAKLVELEFVHEHLHNLRCSFSKVFQKTLPHIQCYDMLVANSFKSIFTWCFENDAKAFRYFKSLVPIEDIFNAIFFHISREYREGLHSLLFCRLDVFLLWYFAGVATDVIKFKLEMKNNPKVLEIWNGAVVTSPCFKQTLFEWFHKSVEAAANTRSPISPVLQPTRK